jgi:hypothetical protein
MHRPFKLIATVATLGALAVPGVAAAADDADVLPGDPAAATTVFGADGSVTDGTLPAGNGAFVKGLPAQHAVAGVLREDTAAYTHPTVIRTGYNRPTTKLAPLKRLRSRAAARAAVAYRATPQPDGRFTVERGMAVEIATGVLRPITIEDAMRLSADPRDGAPGMSYFYSSEGDMPGSGVGQ